MENGTGSLENRIPSRREYSSRVAFKQLGRYSHTLSFSLPFISRIIRNFSFSSRKNNPPTITVVGVVNGVKFWIEFWKGKQLYRVEGH